MALGPMTSAANPVNDVCSASRLFALRAGAPVLYLQPQVPLCNNGFRHGDTIECPDELPVHKSITSELFFRRHIRNMFNKG